jgi:dTDP-4-dehydrorhamnose reductase
MSASRILVIGRAGQLARALATAAKARGIALDAAGRETLDLADPSSLQPRLMQRLQADRPDVVINAAAYTAVDAAESDAEAATRLNAEAPGVLAQACSDAGVPLIHVSTDYVFSGEPGRAWRETDATAPLSVYGASKLAGEENVRQACTQHLIVRTAWLFSALPPNFMTTMIKLARTRSEIAVVDDQIGSPTPAAGLADALLTMAQSAADRRAPWGLYHYAGDTQISWAGFAARILETAGLTTCSVRPIPGSQYPTAARRPAWSVLDSSRAHEAFDCPPADFQSGLDLAVRDFLHAT